MKYANITEVRNDYTDLDLLKNDNIKSYIGRVFLNASGAPFDAFGFLNKSSESAGEICVVQQSKSTITSKVTINQNKFDDEHKKLTTLLYILSAHVLLNCWLTISFLYNNKVTEAMDVDWALLFLTNACKKDNLFIDDKPNSALVCAENFQKFYGYTYTSRAQFASGMFVIWNSLFVHDVC